STAPSTSRTVPAAPGPAPSAPGSGPAPPGAPGPPASTSRTPSSAAEAPPSAPGTPSQPHAAASHPYRKSASIRVMVAYAKAAGFPRPTLSYKPKLARASAGSGPPSTSSSQSTAETPAEANIAWVFTTYTACSSGVTPGRLGSVVDKPAWVGYPNRHTHSSGAAPAAAASARTSAMTRSSPSGPAGQRFTSSASPSTSARPPRAMNTSSQRKSAPGTDAKRRARGWVRFSAAAVVRTSCAHHLVRAIAPGTRLILVGDVDQLPPVGPGYPLRDIIDSGVVPVARLTRIFRQAQQSLIVSNAHRILRGG